MKLLGERCEENTQSHHQSTHHCHQSSWTSLAQGDHEWRSKGRHCQRCWSQSSWKNNIQYDDNHSSTTIQTLSYWDLNKKWKGEKFLRQHPFSSPSLMILIKKWANLHFSYICDSLKKRAPWKWRTFLQIEHSPFGSRVPRRGITFYATKSNERITDWWCYYPWDIYPFLK